MDKEKFTSVHILIETKKKLDKIVTKERRKLYDMLDIIISDYLKNKED